MGDKTTCDSRHTAQKPEPWRLEPCFEEVIGNQ